MLHLLSFSPLHPGVESDDDDDVILFWIRQ